MGWSPVLPNSRGRECGRPAGTTEPAKSQRARAERGAGVQVLPRFVCYCDQDWYASVLRRCRVDGSDLQPPFACPLDTLLNPGALDTAGLPYRMAAYLQDPRTPAAVMQSEERVQMHGDRAWVAAARRRGGDGGGWVATGETAEELRQGLREMEGVSVLRVEGLRPGGFGGWAAAGGNEAFDRAWGVAVGKDSDAAWCCSCVPLTPCSVAVAVAVAELHLSHVLEIVTCACVHTCACVQQRRCQHPRR